MLSLKYHIFSKNNISKSPKENGIYLFLDGNKKVIYIGKSKRLKDRLKSYLTTPLDPKTSLLVKKSAYFSFIVVNSEIEAILLEAKLIKLFKPKLNIQLKDDKHPLYIKITGDCYPRIITVRKRDSLSNCGEYFGPFPSSENVKSVLKTLRKIFPFSQHKLGKKSCFYSQIGLCNPCPNQIEKTEGTTKALLKKKYAGSIKSIKKIFNGNILKVRNTLYKNMVNLSKKELFEEANELKNQIAKLDYITQPVTSINYFITNPNLAEDIRKKELLNLKSLINLFFRNINLIRIECYDVTHSSGKNPTASMVTFINAEPDKSLYRHFRIKQKKTRSDTDSLYEIAKRREKYLPSWGSPDLILVDGGKGQVSSLLKVFCKHKIPVIGIAKRNETLFIPVTEKGVTRYKTLLPKGPALNLIQRIRNEAHRFSQHYHNKLLKKELLPFSKKTVIN